MILRCTNLFISLVIIIAKVRSFPVKREDESYQLEYSNETRYPDGMIVGKYTYKDKEGNPIHVKYFADDSSYGVELKSVKVFDGNSDNVMQLNLPNLESKLSTINNNMFPSVSEMGQIKGENGPLALFNKEFNKSKTYNSLDVLNENTNKINRYKASHKPKDDYEIFLENDLKPTEKCNKEKVKVYVDKYKRKIRNVPYHYKASDFCKRF